MSSIGQYLCSRCDCRPIENRTTGLCATCAREDRKAEAAQVKEKKPINKVSAKRAVENKEYARLRKDYLEAYPVCEVVECHRKATEIHHMKSRAGDLLCDVNFFMAVCRPCHEKITIESAWAIKMGYSFPRTT